MIKLKINETMLEVKEGTTILNAAAALGITIPTLCYHRDLSPFGGCRFCVVEVKGVRLPMTACNTPVIPDMELLTESPTVIRYRRAILRMLLSNYYDAGYKRINGKCGIDEDNILMRYARQYDVDIASAMARHPRYPVDSDPNPFVLVDRNKCIQCLRCVRACAEIQGRFVWSQSYRGYQARVVAGDDATMLASRCESCGACVAYCPTGALDNKMSINAGRPDRLVRTTCTYCAVGCQLDLNVRADRIIRVTSTQEANGSSVNGLHLCLKGRYGYEFIHHPHRQQRPRLREYLLKGEARPAGRGRFVEVDWDTALDLVARKFKKLREQGDGRIGILASGRLLNEESYLLNKMARQALGSNHIDLASNLYSQDNAEALLDSLGVPAMTNSFDDVAARAQSFFVIGSNLTEQHPVFGARIRQSILRRKIPIVVASPDFINLEEYAALSLRHNPGAEAVLVNGLMHIILAKGWQDDASLETYAEGFVEARLLLEQFPPEQVSQSTGVPVGQLYEAAEILASQHPAAVLCGSGLCDPGAIRALANLQLLLGNLGAAGGGVNLLRPQNNTQGAHDMGCMPGYVSGYQSIYEPAVQRKFEQAWGRPLPLDTGLTARDMLQAARHGGIGALYIVGEDILKASPEAGMYRADLEACEFVVLQEMAASETSRYADVIFPGVSFAEKTGTFTSTERRVQLVRQAIPPFGDARPDWLILSELGSRLHSGWSYRSTAQIMDEIAALTPIYAGITHERLEQGERLQWPVRSRQHPGTPILPLGLFSGGEVRWSVNEISR